MLCVLDGPAKASDCLLEDSWILEAGFVDGIQVEPSIGLGIEPLFEDSRVSNLKRVCEVLLDVFDADKERRPPVRFDMRRPGLHLERLSGTGLRYDDRAVSLVDLLPSREVAKP